MFNVGNQPLVLYAYKDNTPSGVKEFLNGAICDVRLTKPYV